MIKKKERKIKKYTASERKAMGLDKMPENKFGEQNGRNPRLHEEPPIEYDPRNRKNDL